MSTLPKILDPCPVVEASIEIRYSTELPGDAVFGVLYAEISKQFPTSLTKLPILQVPEAVRMSDPNLIYQPHYLLSVPSQGNVSVSIGPKVILFSNVQPYIGWNKFFKFVSDALTLIANTTIFDSVERVGLRYIDIFKDTALLGRIHTELIITGDLILTEPTTIRIERTDGTYTLILQIASNADIKSPTINGKGSIIDIDCIYLFPPGSNDFFSVYADIIEISHQKEKSTFFSLLKDDFLQEFNPSY